MTNIDIKRVAAGVPAGGEFASHDRAEAGVALAQPTSCADCGEPTTEEPTRGGVCMPCADDSWQRCRDCGVVEELDGEGFAGRCGNCADVFESNPCSECGEPMRVGDDGVSHHIDFDERIDWEADRDHTPIAEVEEPTDPNETNIGFALGRANLDLADVESIRPLAGGTLLTLRQPHKSGGYDSISVTRGIHGEKVLRFTRAGSLHRLDGFAMESDESTPDFMKHTAWIDGHHQYPPGGEVWPNFSREGTVNTWTSSGSRRVIEDTDPVNGTITWYNDAGIHREGAPALYEAGKEPRWFSNGTEIADPWPKQATWVGSQQALIGGAHIPGEPIVDTQARLADHLARAARVKLLGAGVKITRRGDTLTVTVDAADRDMVRRIADSYNVVTSIDPAKAEREIDIRVVTA